MLSSLQQHGLAEPRWPARSGDPIRNSVARATVLMGSGRTRARCRVPSAHTASCQRRMRHRDNVRRDGYPGVPPEESGIDGCTGPDISNPNLTRPYMETRKTSSICASLLYVLATVGIPYSGTCQLQGSGRSVEYRTLLEVSDNAGHFVGERLPLPALLSTPFVALSAYMVGDQFKGKLEYRYFSTGVWSPWVALPEFGEGGVVGRVAFDVQFIDTSVTFLEVRSDVRIDEELVVRLYYPGHSSNTTECSPSYRSLVCPCPQPGYCNRSCWDPGNDCPADATPSFTTPTHMIVHHSAGQTTSSDFPAVVRSYWDLHVVTNGWDDIGYNWLIDGNGVLYEGRGDGVLGAHFSCMSGGTMGVCVIGNYEINTPSSAAMAKLYNLLAWEACDKNITIPGSSFHSQSSQTLNHISGHLDSNNSPDPDGCPSGTVCPGDNIYNQIAGIRSAVAAEIAACGGECPQPSNDGCSGSFTATLLPFGSSCNPTPSTSCGATSSGFGSCTGAQDDDVFFRFVPTSQTATVTVDGSSGYNAVFQVLTGPCGGGMSELDCVDSTGSGGVETTTVSGLTIGATYFIRVGHNGSGYGTTGDFTVCVHEAIGLPDLDITTGSVTPTVVLAGGDVDVAHTVINNGPGSISIPTETAVYLIPFGSGCPTSIPGAGLIEDNSLTVSEISDGSDNENPSVTIPGGTPAGDYYLVLVVDYLDELNEADESNNIYCVQITVQDACAVPAVPTPTFGSISCPGPSLSSTITLQWNAVPGAAGYRLRVGLYPYDTNDYIDVGAGDCFSGTSYSIPLASFTTGVPLFWSVSAIGECGNEDCLSAYSSPSFFSVLPVVFVSNGTSICAGDTAGLYFDPFWFVTPPGVNSAQWYRDGNAIPGATEASYSATQAGEYSVVLTFTGSNVCADPIVLASSNTVQVVELNADSDADGVPDCIDDCPSIWGTIGSACDDGNVCTINDEVSTSCQCDGVPVSDSDSDGLCDAVDPCPTLANVEPGDACDDGDACTINDVIDGGCSCVGVSVVIPGTPSGITGPSAAGTGGVHTFTAAPVTDATGYIWSTLPADWSGSSTSISIDYTVGTVPAQVCVRAENLGCPGDSLCVWVVDINTGLADEDHGAPWFNIHPNPSDGTFLVTPSGPLTGDIDIRVIDALGQLVSTSLLVVDGQPQRIDLQEQAEGIYFLRANRGKEVRMYQLLIHR